MKKRPVFSYRLEDLQHYDRYHPAHWMDLPNPAPTVYVIQYRCDDGHIRDYDYHRDINFVRNRVDSLNRNYRRK